MNVDPLQVLSKLAAVYNIPACRVTPPFAGLENFDYGLRKALDPEFDWQVLFCCLTGCERLPLWGSCHRR